MKATCIIEDKATFVEVETAPQQFEKREIKTGLSDGINIEVVSGLKAEEKIKHRSQPTVIAERVGNGFRR